MKKSIKKEFIDIIYLWNNERLQSVIYRRLHADSAQLILYIH